MDNYTKKIVATLLYYVIIYGGYIYDINNLISIVGDFDNKNEAIEKDAN